MSIQTSPGPTSYPPLVLCPGCQAAMTVRLIEPSPIGDLSTAHYRCLICKTEAQREFKVET